MLAKILAHFSSIRHEIESGNFNAVLTRFSDLILVMCIALMVGLMIVPLPTFLLDIFLTLNITVAITILMVSLYVSNGAQIASYPTILLLTTLYRLSLEISSTRLILLKADAGEVIKAFGQFVVGGNFVVGAVIFLIITLVQFIVITKGSERVAEVAARFTLDAMPGKQMSIDADLRAGSIDFKVARKRRQMLAKESQFYGAMDGAMKFVKGDAIAGIIITVINIVGGLIIGVAMNGLPASEAVQTYSILTIGDGLVSQIPALLISISAGMVVTRVASEDEESNIGSDIAGQILAQPKAIGIAAAILLVMGLLPGMPKFAFLLLTVVTGGVSYGLYRAKRLKEEALAQTQKPAIPVAAAPPSDPDITMTVPLVIEVGQELAPLVSLQTEVGKDFLERLIKLRQLLYGQLGVVFPSLRVDAAFVPFVEGGNFRFWLNEVPITTGSLRTDRILVNASAQKLAEYGIDGDATTNPANHKPATWIDRSNLEPLAALDLKTWDTYEILLLHISGFLRGYARDFISVQEVQWTINRLKKFYPTLVDEVVPKVVSMQQLTEVLQHLLAEEVSIRDVKTILQAIASANPAARGDTLALSEHVRIALRRRLCYQLSDGKPRLVVYRLDSEVEDLIRSSIRQGPTGPFLAMDPEQIQMLTEAVRNEIGNAPAVAQNPVLLVDGSIRRYVRNLLADTFPELRALSYNELTPEINVEPIGTISLNAVPESQEDQLALT
ncbi:MAG TPA: type III secretion system export apparatus subunit SctV [Bryobacteraceae bacterium]|nr:type III secretion system export apparatus subunit SctV [Bryobacteraceae bacterium]